MVSDTWAVITGEYSVVVPVCDDGTGPIESTVDIVYVECACADAKALGIKMLRQEGSTFLKDCESDGRSPFTELSIEKARCPHGVGWWEQRDCQDCLDDCL
jgi:hypothetical protein